MNIPVDVILVYLHLLWLVPSYLLQRNIKKYFVLSMLVIVSGLIFNFILPQVVFNQAVVSFSIDAIQSHACSLALSVLVLVYAVMSKFFKEYIIADNLLLNLQKEHLESEVDFLKSQMNPHFLFNTLNGISVLVKLDPEKASESILRLSDLLRYHTYECAEDQVLISSEAEYLKNYISLQNLRFPHANISLETEGEFGGLTIYPFIFLPFVENAVKHGVGNSKNINYIRILIHVLNKKLSFVVHNTKAKDKICEKGGLGLINIKRRLELLYPGNYNLIIDENETTYNVKLNINLTQ